MKVAIVGASGLVGGALVEYLSRKPDIDVVPLIHSSGNAWRLLALGAQPVQMDLLSGTDVEVSLSGCTHVVNCSRGSDEVMYRGLHNLLKHCNRQGIKKFVHLSSVAIYGDPPSSDSVFEEGPTRPAKDSYGWMKLQQDEMVQRAAKRGLPAIILCPPNIFGPSSYFLMQVLDSLLNRRFRLVDSGGLPCNTVDVMNLSHAIFLALNSEKSSAQRYFITDDLPVSWADVVGELLSVVGTERDVGRVDKEALHKLRGSITQRRTSILQALKHLVSSDIREALRKDPLWAKFDYSARSLVSKLGPRLEDRLRLTIEGPLKVQRREQIGSLFDVPLVLQQMRGVRHSCRRATKELSYEPLVSFHQSMTAFRNWYQVIHGVDAEDWDLAQYLYS